MLTKRVSRGQMLAFMAQLPPCRIGLEACGGAHYWARELIQLGHDVKMMAPQHVKPYVHGNNTDRRDAQAICEAASRPYVQAVPVSTLLQQDIQTIHRVRQQCIKSRTALVNQLRGLLAEYGLLCLNTQNRHPVGITLLESTANVVIAVLVRRYILRAFTQFARVWPLQNACDHALQAIFDAP